MSPRRLLALGLALVVAACSSPPPESRYSRSKDSAPSRIIAPEDVADAVPRPDPILPAGNKSPYTVAGVTYNVLPDHRGYSERGVASWYGAKFEGYETSNGEIFDPYVASAAHRTLPLPSYARVTNLENGRSVVVRINDRGPFHSDRLIDLSYAAAVRLGFAQQGTAPVEVQILELEGIDDQRGSTAGNYRYLQLGAFGTESSALRLQDLLKSLVSAPVFVSRVDTGEARLYRVRVGPVADNEQLKSVRRVLVDHGYDPGMPLP